jgi:prophage regulatory protein
VLNGSPERILRKPEVRDRVGLSDTTLWRRVRDGEFPQPIRISKGSVGWLESEVDQWIAERAGSR